MKRYKNASELYDIFYNERKEDIAFYNRLLTEYKNNLDNNRIIEIGAGTGRVLLPIAEKHPDLEFHAVDMIGDEITVLADKARERGIKNVVTHVADINEFADEEKFSFAFAPFRVMQHCQSVEELNRFVGSTKNLLTENGRFAFDLFNPWIHMLVREGVVFDGNYHDKDRSTAGWRLTSAIISNRRKISKNIIPLDIRTVKPIISNGCIRPVTSLRIPHRWCWRKTN